jgi:NTP pyrophosphatase (non-canonical NTP hydrolase)
MTPNKYQKEALRTEQPTSTVYNGTIHIMLARGSGKTAMLQNVIEADVEMNRLINGLMGLNGEAGEAIDILKKHLFQGHELDKDHLAEELGDVAWYLAVTADALGYSLEEILQMNIEKLQKRYPDGFDSERSVNRE